MTDQNSCVSETLNSLRGRQRQAWQRGERLLVESLASAAPTPLQENELQELIVAEVTLRQELGETCTSVEYVQRFPRLAETLQRLFDKSDQNDGGESQSAETNSVIAGAKGKSQSTIDPMKPDVIAALNEQNVAKQAAAPEPPKDPQKTDSRVVVDPFATVTFRPARLTPWARR